MIESKKMSAMLSRSWKKSLNNGIVIPTKMRRCNECKDKVLCTTRNDQIDENKEFEAKLNELERHSPNDFGHLLPYYKIFFSTFCTKSSNLYSCPLLYYTR